MILLKQPLRCGVQGRCSILRAGENRLRFFLWINALYLDGEGAFFLEYRCIITSDGGHSATYGYRAQVPTADQIVL